MIVECVPNFSEGRNEEVIDKIAAAVPANMLLHRTSDPDHNRTVLTFAGGPQEVADAAFGVVRACVENIDLARHSGVHPKLGAADVVPFVPVSGVSLEDCAELARNTGRRIWTELGVPVFLYEAAAHKPEHRRLEQVRRLNSTPDFGSGRHPSAGACVVGARPFLIAWNINLETADLDFARGVAAKIREANGGLPGVKALGFRLESRRQVQVSINLVDFEATPLHVVFQAVEGLCSAGGVEIAGSELIGLLPAKALDGTHGHDLKWLNLDARSLLETRLTEIAQQPSV
jgi:glutamate formiminotransferase/glutamate formiminotransferase/formiminotetrahydrofolate cyclodeaminase